MAEKTGVPERLKLNCVLEPDDSLRFEGPDVDGELLVSIDDVVTDAVTLSQADVAKLHAFLGRFLEKVGKGAA